MKFILFRSFIGATLLVGLLFAAARRTVDSHAPIVVAADIPARDSNTVLHIPLNEDPNSRPQIELVFCLDATGSMSGLIQTAKEKIWDIVTSLTQANPAPEIRLGMIFYRDRGDLFVTKVIPLTVDIDRVYADLLLMDANGGGDSPESVSLALHQAVKEMQWTPSGQVYRSIFLVGDCAPHTDYKDEVPYQETCKQAKLDGLVINSIKLGMGCHDAIAHFQAIAELTLGEYLELDQEAGDVVIASPYDDSINVLSKSIDMSKFYYGSSNQQDAMTARQVQTLRFYAAASEVANTARASYNVSESGADNWFGSNELLRDLETIKVKLDTLKEEALPKEFRGLSKSELKQKVAAAIQEREQQTAALKRLLLERERFVGKEKLSRDVDNTFSGRVFAILKRQAASFGVLLNQ